LLNFLLIAIGGSIGATLRYSFYLLFKNILFSNYLFFNTLLINIIGSFFIGYIIMIIGNKNFSQDFIKFFFIIGILGSFTTFSTFSIESIDLLIERKYFLAFSYMFLSLSLCLLFTFLGLNLNKLVN